MPLSFGRWIVTGPAVVLTVAGLYPLPCILRHGRALVAGPAQEDLDFSFQRGLDDQPGAEPGDILD